jgi:hypothetical protein
MCAAVITGVRQLSGLSLDPDLALALNPRLPQGIKSLSKMKSKKLLTDTWNHTRDEPRL